VRRAALLALAALAAGLGAPRPSAAQWPNGITIDQTPHNLTRPAKNTDPDMRNRIADFDEICVYCHAPHWGAGPTPLWNRPNPAGGYRMPEINDPDMIQDPQPTGNSVKCLSCHDGTIGLDGVIKPPITFSGPRFGQTIDECEGCHSGGNPAGGIDWEGVWLDTDLRKQHPFSVLYDPSRDPNFRSIAEVEAAGLVLYDGKVQCMTCHEPHTERYRPFLRIPRTGFCSVCHIGNPGESTAHHW